MKAVSWVCGAPIPSPVSAEILPRLRASAAFPSLPVLPLPSNLPERSLHTGWTEAEKGTAYDNVMVMTPGEGDAP